MTLTKKNSRVLEDFKTRLASLNSTDSNPNLTNEIKVIESEQKFEKAGDLQEHYNPTISIAVEKRNRPENDKIGENDNFEGSLFRSGSKFGKNFSEY